MSWLFLLAYTCSGLAGLIYEVSWTRLLTLYVGHTTAAASAVVAAFLGGLALGAGGGGVWAARLSPARSLRAYVALEIVVALFAIALPYELKALTPLLRWSYQNGDPGSLFPVIRLLACLWLVFLPATALGATFPLAIRWFAHTSPHAAGSSGTLYAANTAGAAVGALLAGFTLIPAIGLSGTTRIGVLASLLAAASVWVVTRLDARYAAPAQTSTAHGLPRRPKPPRRSKNDVSATPSLMNVPVPAWLAGLVLGLSGFAALMHEIVWTRVLSLLLGPTTYAFAATIAAVITGVAVGSALGAWIAGRTRHAAAWLALVLAGAALTTSGTTSLAGGQIPRLIAQQMATSPYVLDQLFRQGTLVTAALILPTALCLGAAFPLALAITSGSSSDARRFGLVYAINTVGSVAGSLLAGFLFIPLMGLQSTLRVVSLSLVAAAVTVIVVGRLTGRARLASAVAAVVTLGVVALSPPWDRELLASGAYLYAPYVPKDLNLETLLKAGTLLYYREGAASTVSVKRLTGTTTLAVDGKVDASNRSDMLTQKLIAHLPLLLHDHPREVGIIGLGSGVTVGAALSHPITRADVIEISPEVVEASQYFTDDNHHALADPRTHLIVGDGRSHLMLSERRYDVIISEPSNPWIAGVAALFTREFFEAAKSRLAPGGVICQWAHTYNISDSNLRSIVATFGSVFPNGTLWLVGGSDVLLVASVDPVDSMDRRLENMARAWARPGVAEDLRQVAAAEPFSLLSLYGGGPRELAQYGHGAEILTDDRMTLEFSGPRALHTSSALENGDRLSALLNQADAPPPIRQSRSAAGAAQWRNRALMMAKSDMHAAAYDDYVRALEKDPGDALSLEGIAKEAMLAGRVSDALSWVKGLTANRAPDSHALVTLSKLFAASAMPADAIDAAHEAARLAPDDPAASEQLASLFADHGDLAQLDRIVDGLQRTAPSRSGTHYYAAVAAFLHGNADRAVELGQRATTADPVFPPAYDLLGAAYTKLGRLAEARDAFLRSLHFDAHDSTAYTNLGLVALRVGDREEAARYFAEALNLVPNSSVAREGLAQAR